MKLQSRLNLRKKLRARRARAKISGTGKRPRLSVFRSNKFIYAQLIDDESRKTIASATDKELIGSSKEKRLSKVERAKELGKTIAQKAKRAKIEEVVFDRGPYQYHGRVRAIAEGAREGGLKF